jgi:hypothetical protein
VAALVVVMQTTDPRGISEAGKRSSQTSILCISGGKFVEDVSAKWFLGSGDHVYGYEGRLSPH